MESRVTWHKVLFKQAFGHSRKGLFDETIGVEQVPAQFKLEGRLAEGMKHGDIVEIIDRPNEPTELGETFFVYEQPEGGVLLRIQWICRCHCDIATLETTKKISDPVMFYLSIEADEQVPSIVLCSRYHDVVKDLPAGCYLFNLSNETFSKIPGDEQSCDEHVMSCSYHHNLVEVDMPEALKEKLKIRRKA